jgi:hypothetical protein
VRDGDARKWDIQRNSDIHRRGERAPRGKERNTAHRIVGPRVNPAGCQALLPQNRRKSPALTKELPCGARLQRHVHVGHLVERIHAIAIETPLERHEGVELVRRSAQKSLKEYGAGRVAGPVAGPLCRRHEGCDRNPEIHIRDGCSDV